MDASQNIMDSNPFQRDLLKAAQHESELQRQPRNEFPPLRPTAFSLPVRSIHFENLPPSVSSEALELAESPGIRHNYDNAIPIENHKTAIPIDNHGSASPFEVPFFSLLVISLLDNTSTDIYNTFRASAWTWVGINPSCGQALPGVTGDADFDSNGHPREYKPPARRKTIHVWECCQCGRGNLNIQLEQCPDCGVSRCAYCQTTRVSVRS
ncbi:hypothetical protein DL98DRAFT_662101 [Cadophora sp. DSE1049]|nr:hypothetical protein DL98DRAFT_662101 [Cadophora sp. DSE1049]